MRSLACAHTHTLRMMVSLQNQTIARTPDRIRDTRTLVPFHSLVMPPIGLAVHVKCVLCTHTDRRAHMGILSNLTIAGALTTRGTYDMCPYARVCVCVCLLVSCVMSRAFRCRRRRRRQRTEEIPSLSEQQRAHRAYRVGAYGGGKICDGYTYARARVANGVDVAGFG